MRTIAADNRFRNRGVTAIELAIVVGILLILAAIVVVALDPARRLRQARNARREAEATAVMNALLNYAVDHRGALPAAVESASASGIPYVIGSATSVPEAACPLSATGLAVNATATVDLGSDAAFVGPYLSALPVDPSGINAAGVAYGPPITGYYLVRSANSRLEVGSCNPEDERGHGTAQIKVRR